MNLKKIKSFSLIEIMIMLSFITFVFSSVIGTSIIWYQKYQYKNHLYEEVNNIRNAIENYMLIYGKENLINPVLNQEYFNVSQSDIENGTANDKWENIKNFFISNNISFKFTGKDYYGTPLIIKFNKESNVPSCSIVSDPATETCCDRGENLYELTKCNYEFNLIWNYLDYNNSNNGFVKLQKDSNLTSIDYDILFYRLHSPGYDQIWNFENISSKDDFYFPKVDEIKSNIIFEEGTTQFLNELNYKLNSNNFLYSSSYNLKNIADDIVEKIKEDLNKITEELIYMGDKLKFEIEQYNYDKNLSDKIIIKNIFLDEYEENITDKLKINLKTLHYDNTGIPKKVTNPITVSNLDEKNMYFLKKYIPYLEENETNTFILSNDINNYYMTNHINDPLQNYQNVIYNPFFMERFQTRFKTKIIKNNKIIPLFIEVPLIIYKESIDKNEISIFYPITINTTSLDNEIILYYTRKSIKMLN